MHFGGEFKNNSATLCATNPGMKQRKVGGQSHRDSSKEQSFNVCGCASESSEVGLNIFGFSCSLGERDRWRVNGAQSAVGKTYHRCCCV